MKNIFNLVRFGSIQRSYGLLLFAFRLVSTQFQNNKVMRFALLLLSFILKKIWANSVRLVSNFLTGLSCFNPVNFYTTPVHCALISRQIMN
jgi:hypothetical protein